MRDVFFDFGGTLVHARRTMLPIFRAAAARSGAEVPWARFLRANDAAWDALWPTAAELVGADPPFADRVHERALREVGIDGPVDAIVRAVREEAVAPRWHPPYPETVDVLRALRTRGLRLHIVSNNVDYLPELVRNLGWSDLFASVTFSQEVGASKPDPRIFRKALERSGRSPPEVVHVGDSWEADILGARAAGLASVWVNRTGRPSPSPVPAIRDLRGLLPMLSTER